MKVFEFAKEVGMETILLMDKIREWKLPIKSHMATLDDEMISAIKTKLTEESEAAKPKKTVKKSATKTAAASASTAAEKPAATKKVATRTVKKEAPTEVVAEKKTAAKSVAAAAKEAAATEKANKEKKTVITKKAATAGLVLRRKAGDATGTQVIQPEPKAPEQTESESENIVDDQGAAQGAATGDTSGATPQAASGAPTDAAGAPRKRNIIGRMDLSKARPPSGTPSQSGGGDRSPRPGAAGGARNIRTGFFAAQPAPVDEKEAQESFEEMERKKEERRRKAAGGAREEAPQTFNAADFRKREVIFQPKKKKLVVNREAKKTQLTTPKASKRIIRVEKTMTVADLAAAMGQKSPALIKKLMQGGVMASLNTELDFDTISLLATEFDYEAQNVFKTADDLLNEAAFGDTQAEAIYRPPVVTVMGHVDHGKTSLLDAIRSAKVAAGEAGGITQHIGAYKVKVEGGKEITFLDTPGHEAFTAMRARGANVTDIAIIVVAADDGVMPQTAEAISHAKAAGVPIIIAVNKIDKPGANVDRIKQQLTEYQIVPEEWGGSNIFCEVSALKKTGIKELLDQILLVAEVEDLKANPKRSGTGTVIESRLDKGKGCVATLLVKDGTVRTGDTIVLGTIIGRVRGMTNDRGEAVKEAIPGDPVEIIGLPGSPLAGDRFDIVKDESTGNEVVEARRKELNKPVATGKDAVTLEQLFAKIQKGEQHELNVVVKADVSGSVEALRGMLEKAGTDQVKVKIVYANVGGVSESDVLLASTSGGLILAFNVRPDTSAMRLAKERNIEIKTYTIIYELLDDVKKAMAGLLKPVTKEVVRGRAEVREVFSVPKLGNIGGCSVIDGKITRSDLCRLIREGTIVFQGKLGSLRRFKDDVKEVASGFECGMSIENYNDIKVGDIIEAYVIEETAQLL